MNLYQIIREFKLEERDSFSRSVIPGETSVGREIPRFDYVRIVLVKHSTTPVSKLKTENLLTETVHVDSVGSMI